MTEVKIAAQTSEMMFDREAYFDSVRSSLFPGGMTQQQVDGQEAILSWWEKGPRQSDDLRHLANPLAQTKHESASTMWPIEEYGRGGDSEYAQIDPETGQGYWGRGLIQTTWRDNYARADREMGWTEDASCEWHADLQLTPEYAVPTMFRGMWEGWFRSGHTLGKYLNETTDDVFNCREIINGDKNYHVSWDSRTIGEIIAGYHDDFLAALEASVIYDGDEDEDDQPRPPRPPLPPLPPLEPRVVTIDIVQPFGVKVVVNVKEPTQEEKDALRRRIEQLRLQIGK